MTDTCLMDEAKIALYGFGLLFSGFVIWVLVLFAVAFKKRKDSKSWPRTTGLITHSSVESGFVQAGGGNAFVFIPKVIYEYEVDGKQYTSSQLAIIERNTASEDLAREKAEKYVQGQQVEVYYDPRNPACAVLDRG